MNRPPATYVIAGAGAAGYFTAIHSKSLAPDARVLLLEKSRDVLAKVAISGGGRCNLTHHCFDPGELIHFYPRGARELRGPFHRWGPQQTIDWFREHGVPSKTEPDGRMFPASNQSESVVNCLATTARDLGVELQTLSGLRSVRALEPGGFELELDGGAKLSCDALCIATGGNRQSGGMELAASLGHRIQPPVPSLFSFHVRHALLDDLPGISVDPASVRLVGEKKAAPQSGPILITHRGLSGPAILKLSAWEARRLASKDYHFDIEVNWCGSRSTEELRERFSELRNRDGSRRVGKHPPLPLPKRLWERMVDLAGAADCSWASLPAGPRDELLRLLTACRLPVAGKTLNKDEFVTCGGVDLREVDMKRFESRLHPGLFFAGEVLDIDGVTGGFNFQAAWTGGYHAGTAMGSSFPPA